MAARYPLQDTFVRGEISPRLHARASLDLYRAGLSQCYNFLTLPHGGIRKRGGTYFVASTKNATLTSRLIPFVFSADQAYCLEFGHFYVRVYAYGARVGTVEVATPWSWDELDDLQFYQSADQMWLAHPDHALRVLTRLAHETWTLEEYVLEDGPYSEMDTQGTKLWPADYGSSVPLMTGDAAPSGTVSYGSGSDGWRVFDKTIEPYNSGDTGPGFVAYSFGGGINKTVNAYSLEAYGAEYEQLSMPNSWKFQGSDDGVTWVTLDSRSSETGWSPGEKRFYEFTNKRPYAAYMLFWSSTEQAGGGDTITFAELSLNQDGDEQTPFNLVADSIIGINDGAGFQATDVGRSIRLQGSDGNWRWARIVSYVDGATVTIRLYGHALPDLSPISNWRFGALGGDTNASAVAIYEERMALASKFSMYLSKSFDLNRFSPGEEDDAGLSFTNAGGGQANDIVWIADGDGYLLMATTGGVRALSGSGIDEALTPSSFKNRRSRTHGAAKIAPVDAGSSFLYVTRSRRTIAELTMNQYGRFSSEDIGTISEHLPKQGVNAIAYQENPDPVLWFTTDPGELCGYTHQPSQEVRGMYHFRTGEGRYETANTTTADRFESVCVTPGQDGENDDVWVVVQRTIGGVTKRFIELLTAPLEGPIINDGSANPYRAVNVMDSFTLDCGLTYDGAATGTVTGLSHLEGETVSVLADSRIYHDLTVSGGSVTLPDGATAAKWHVGMAWGAVATTLELDVGSRDGSLVGRRKKVSRVILSLYETDTSGLLISSVQRGRAEEVRIPSTVAPDGTVSLFTGNVEVPIDDSWEGMGKFYMIHVNPTPCTIRAMTPVFESEP
jgi:hypothetical protein